MGSSRLYEFAKLLDVPVSYFFDQMPSTALAGRPVSGRGRKDGFGEAGTPFKRDKNPLIKRETCAPTTRFAKAGVRKRICETIEAVGAASHAKVLGRQKRRR